MSEHQLKSLQQHNAAAERIIAEIKNFLYIEEKGEGSHSSVNPREMGKTIVLAIDFHHKNHVEKMLERLKLFGFPAASSVSKTHATFTNIGKCSPIVSPRTVLMDAALQRTELDEVYDMLCKWTVEKGYKNRIVKGLNFIRVQKIEFAKTVVNLLGTRFDKRYKFHRNGEEIFILPVAATGAVSSDAPSIEKKGEFLSSVVIEIFNIEIFDYVDTREGTFIAFTSEELVEKAHVLCNEYELPCTIKGKSLQFQLPDVHLSYEDIKELYSSIDSFTKDGLPGADEQQGSLEGGSPQIVSEDEFYAQVRAYIKGLGYKKKTHSSMCKQAPYVYRMGLLGDLDALIAKATEEKPEWKVEKTKSLDNPWALFSLIGSVGGQKTPAVQNPKKESPATAKPIDSIRLPRKLLATIEALRREPTVPKALRGETNKAMELLTELGWRVGLVYEGTIGSKVEPACPNARYIKWKNDLDEARDKQGFFTKLGYVTHFTGKAMRFLSIFPGKALDPIIEEQPTSHGDNLSTVKPVEEKKQVARAAVSYTIVLSNEQALSVLQGVSAEDLLAEISRRGIDLRNILPEVELSDEDLIAIVTKRGPEFGQLLFQTLWQKK